MPTPHDDPCDRDARPGWLRRNVVISVLVLVALHQLVLVHTHGLTRWKGGGFGMYSDFHVHQRQVWLATVTPPEADHAVDASTRLARTRMRAAARRCGRFANRACLEELATHGSAFDLGGARIQLWEFDMDVERSRFGRRLAMEVTLP